MNEFIQRKLGEVVAFARIGSDTMTKGEEGFSKILSEEDIEDLKRTFNDLENRLLSIAESEDVLSEVEADSRETEEKVLSMRDTYISEKWDDESELLEWMGFYNGAALVHLHLIYGAAETLGFEELLFIARDALEFYQSLFVSDERTLQDIGGASV